MTQYNGPDSDAHALRALRSLGIPSDAATHICEAEAPFGLAVRVALVALANRDYEFDARISALERRLADR